MRPGAFLCGPLAMVLYSCAGEAATTSSTSAVAKPTVAPFTSAPVSTPAIDSTTTTSIQPISTTEAPTTTNSPSLEVTYPEAGQHFAERAVRFEGTTLRCQPAGAAVDGTGIVGAVEPATHPLEPQLAWVADGATMTIEEVPTSGVASRVGREPERSATPALGEVHFFSRSCSDPIAFN